MDFEPTVKNILDQKTLKWVFVGGKGGVGKTTTSSSLAALLAQSRKVLIISTDPAHNLSDCYDQKFSKNPEPVNGFKNLFAMEIDPKVDNGKLDQLDLFEDEAQNQSAKNIVSEIFSSVPGIDEAMSFSQLIGSIEKMEFDTIVFDTAPTGHTLRFLNFPNLIEKGLQKIVMLKEKFNSLLSSVSGIFGSKQEMDAMIDKVFKKLEAMKDISTVVNKQMKNPSLTTFVAVCIPEFLSMYETQRLIQQLAKFKIDVHNIVINQVLFPEDQCRMCKARSKMQHKYLSQITELYDDFHVTIMPLLDEEVRGAEKITKFSELLLQAKKLPELQK